MGGSFCAVFCRGGGAMSRINLEWVTLPKLNVSVAIAAIASPGWLPSLAEVSEKAALWTPILGGMLIFIQAGYTLHKWWRGK